MQATSPRRERQEGSSPFDWKRQAEQQAKPAATAGQRRRRAASAAHTAAERAARILAQRWGNPYCKPGWP